MHRCPNPTSEGLRYNRRKEGLCMIMQPELHAHTCIQFINQSWRTSSTWSRDSIDPLLLLVKHCWIRGHILSISLLIKQTNNNEFFMMVARGAHSALYSCLPLSCDIKFRFRFGRFGSKKLAPRPNSKPRYLECSKYWTTLAQKYRRHCGLWFTYTTNT